MGATESRPARRLARRPTAHGNVTTSPPRRARGRIPPTSGLREHHGPPHTDSPAHAHRPPSHPATRPPGWTTRGRPQTSGTPARSTAEIAPPAGRAERRQARPGTVEIDQERSEEPRPQTPSPSPIRQPQPHTAGTPRTDTTPGQPSAPADRCKKWELGEHFQTPASTTPPSSHARSAPFPTRTRTRERHRDTGRGPPRLTYGTRPQPRVTTHRRHAPTGSRARENAARRCQVRQPEWPSSTSGSARARLEHSGRAGSGELGASTAR